MTYALDTNIVTFFLKKDGNVTSNIKKALVNGNNLAIVPVVYYETKRWLLMANHLKRLRTFEELYQRAEKPETDKMVWEKALEIYVALGKKGKPSGDSDILIAAHCIVNGYTLVTNNTKDFENIDRSPAESGGFLYFS